MCELVNNCTSITSFKVYKRTNVNFYVEKPGPEIKHYPCWYSPHKYCLFFLYWPKPLAMYLFWKYFSEWSILIMIFCSTMTVPCLWKLTELNWNFMAPLSGLHFHVVGEGVVRLKGNRAERICDRESYIDFRMRLLGEPGVLCCNKC